MPDVDSTATAGLEVRGYRRGALSTDGWDQYVVPVRDRISSYQGRASSFRTLGRTATTTAQPILSIYNASATVLVCVNRVMVDMIMGAARAATVLPPIIRVSRVTTLHTAGTVITPVALDTGGTQDSSVTVRGDTASDGGASTTLVATNVGTPLTQEFGPRVAGGAGTNPWFEPADRMEFFAGEPDIILRQNQGLVIHIAGASGTILTTDHFLATIDWEEFTRP